MAPKIATYSFRHNTIPEAVVMTKAHTRKGEILINDPPYDSERSSDWYQELLIPYKMQGVTYAVMGSCFYGMSQHSALDPLLSCLIVSLLRQFSLRVL